MTMIMTMTRKTRVAINGFGRIGRLFFRQAFGNKELDIVAINDLGEKENLVYLLEHDTVYGRYEANLKKVSFFQEKNPAKLPWGKLGIDIVVESTGVFETYEKAKVHLEAGAKRVVLTAPAKDEDGLLGRTILMGINDSEIKTKKITSNASCTTNAASPVIQIMNETVGIRKAILNTVHGYTATQNLVDGPAKGNDMRRGRAAAQNIVPSTTGAAIAVTRAIKELTEKFDGLALRVPVPSGSIADITFVSKRKTSVKEINDIFRASAKEPRWQGILKITESQIVSSDIVGEPYAAIVDLNFTKVIDGDLVKVLSWYDNEWGYVATLVKHVLGVASSI